MKPEHIHRLTGRDVLRYRRKNFDLMTGLAVAIALVSTPRCLTVICHFHAR